MEAAIVYFGKVNLYLIVFFGCYWLLFRKLTFFRWNRFYLLGSLAAALLLPLVTITETLVAEAQTDTGISVTSVSSQPVAEEPLSWVTVITLTYLLGSLTMLGIFIRSLVQIVKIVRNGERHRQGNFFLIIADHSSLGSFSFFKWLVLNRRDFAESPETILAHEQVHIRQWHSLDIVLVELIKACFWINPAIWFYKSALQITHEYLADQQAADREQYATFLVSYNFGLPAQTLQNSFLNSSQLKTRIQMLYNRRTSPWSLTKYALLVPVVATLVFSTAARNYEFIEPAPAVTKSKPVSIKPAYADDIEISGIVTDDKGKPMPGANIVLKNAHRGTSTNREGKFTMNVPQNGVIVASHISYEAAEMAVKKDIGLYKFVLKPEKAKPVRISEAAAAPQTVPAATEQKSDYKVMESKAEFPGGEQALAEFLKSNMKFPEPAFKAHVSGKVNVIFRVNEEGTVGDIRIMKGIGFGADAESVRILKAMPKWKPAIQNNEAVSSEHTMEINFDYDKEKERRAKG